MLAGLAWGRPAAAWHPATHRTLTEQSCVAAGLDPLACRRAAAGSVHEDTNFQVKLFSFWHGHFFDPRKTRADLRSAERLRVLWDEARVAAARGDRDRAWDRLGHLVHHLQDMADPLHVVPVQHGPTDGFERLADRWLARHPTALGLAEPVTPMAPVQVQAEVAKRTRDSLDDVAFRDAAGRPVPWLVFWTPGDGGWGEYGPAVGGNVFADEEIRYQGRLVHPDREGYVQRRLSDARAATVAVLTWARRCFDGEVACGPPPPSDRRKALARVTAGLEIDAHGDGRIGRGLRLGASLPGSFGLDVAGLARGDTWLGDQLTLIGVPHATIAHAGPVHEVDLTLGVGPALDMATADVDAHVEGGLRWLVFAGRPGWMGLQVRLGGFVRLGLQGGGSRTDGGASLVLGGYLADR